MLPVLPLFQGVCLKGSIERIKILNVTNITAIPMYMWKKMFWKIQNSQCYQYYCYSRVYLKNFIEKNKIPNVTNITVIPGCMWKNQLKKSKFPMLPILPLFHGVCLKWKNQNSQCYQDYCYSRCIWKKSSGKNQNSQCYQYYHCSMVFV